IQDSVATPSPGLALAGFLRDRATLTADAIGIGNDQLNIPATFVRANRDDGALVRPFTTTEIPSAPNLAWRLEAQSGFEIRAIVAPAATPLLPDPLGFPSAFAARIDTVAVGTTLDLKSQCREYTFEIRDTTGTAAKSITQ